MQPGQTSRNKAIALIVITVLAVTTFSLVLFGQRFGKTEVSVNIVGKNPQLYANDIKVSSTSYLKQGSYTLRAEAEGFKTSSKEVVVTAEPLETQIILSPISESAKTWAKDHERDYLKAEGTAGAQTRKEGEAFFETYPLTQILPIKGSYYAINYRLDTKGGPIIEITSTSALGRQVALEQIKSRGYNVSDYQLKFVGLDNPFTSEIEK